MAWRNLGRTLAELRLAAGYTQHVFAGLVQYGRSSVANTETGRQQSGRSFWVRCDAVLHGTRAEGETLRELRRVEARWAEFASWTADNLGDARDASYWLRHALSLSHQADDDQMISYVLMRQAQHAVERRDPDSALTYRQDEGMTRTWLATAYVLRGRIEETAEQADKVLTLAAETGSVRLTQALRRVDAELAAYRSQPPVQRFRARYALAAQISGRIGT
ncbi:helix-turn-helix domain-containing protein [Micromonospora sp. CA-263727]|uniref:helix-turn-helix domain-containing protein n=1 Tax=Micromonospora sp. CA-263727 TaxID=3239967 RepID=UPI003D9322FF